MTEASFARVHASAQKLTDASVLLFPAKAHSKAA